MRREPKDGTLAAPAEDAGAASIPRREEEPPRELSSPREYLGVLVVIAVVTIVGRFAPLSYAAFGHIYLFTVIALSLRVGRRPALFAAVVSALTWDFVFVPPQLSFSVPDFDDVLLLGTYFVVAIIGSQLTARMRAEQREERRRALLAESERLHRTLLDSVSHELRTPLSVLNGAAERLSSAPPERMGALGDEICTATRRLDHLVANLLGQTRLEAGALRPQLDWCDARDLVASARRPLEEALSARTIRVAIPDELPLFRADAVLMEQVLANLLLNAARHTPPAAAVRISAGLVDDRIFIAVEDDGPGLPPGIAEDPFRKFHSSRQGGAGGLGLGLSIVRGFMLAQGGEVTAGKSPGGGAVFTVYLPHTLHTRVPEDEL